MMTTDQLSAIAADLAVTVADGDYERANRVVDDLTRTQLRHVVLTLAAHVNVDKPWVRTPTRAELLARHIVDQVVLDAARRFRLTTGELLTGRTRNAIDARHAAAHALRLIGVSTPKIGVAFGRNHTTVLYGANRAAADTRLAGIARELATGAGWDVTRHREEGAA